MEGRQGQLAGAVEEVKQGLAQHSHKLDGIEQTCTQLLQVGGLLTAAGLSLQHHCS
jgi:hypothetical protein